MPETLEMDKNGNYLLGADGRVKGAKNMICHSFVADGKIRFLGDCTHHLNKTTVELPIME